MNIARKIIYEIKNFNLKVLVEGIENIDDLKLVKFLNCDFAQGFYLEKPWSLKIIVKHK